MTWPYLLLAKIGALGAFLLSVYMVGHHQGEKAVQASWDLDKAHMIEAQAKMVSDRQQEIEKLTAKRAEDNAKVQDDYEKAVKDISAQRDAAVRAGGLRLPASVCRPSPAGNTKTASAPGRNETDTGTVFLPQQITDDLFDQAQLADEVTEQLRACQSWIRDSGNFHE